MSIFDDPDDDPGLDRPDDPLRFGTDSGDTANDPISVLESATLIAARDPGRLLWALATAGAQVRRAVAAAPQWVNPGWTTADRPRATFVVTDSAAAVAGALLAELGGDRTAVLDWRAGTLPRWAGPADVLLAASIDGRHPRVATLVAQAQRRGVPVVVATPDQTPVAAAAGRETVVAIDTPATRRAALWTLLTPLLLAGAALGVVPMIATDFDELADALDTVAETLRPNSDAYTNAAKQLAIEVVESEAMIVGIGPLAARAADCMARSLGLLAGVTAIPLALPDDVTRAGALIDIPIGSGSGERGDDDFFRDRVEDAARRRRLLFVSEVGPDNRRDPNRAPTGADDELAQAGELAAIALDHLATSRGILSSTIDLPGSTPLARFAAAVAFGDFTGAYAAIGRGIDPTAARAGELPH